MSLKKLSKEATIARVATCSLKQWAMDFQGNTQRIIESISMAAKAGARFRTGPELEISGYGCEDEFLNTETFDFCWDALADIAKFSATVDMLIDIGMPIIHEATAYNCRVFMYNGKILLIRPKTILADDGNYRESRWFLPWSKNRTLEEFILPHSFGFQKVPFGCAAVQLLDCCVASETCEELWAPENPHVELCLRGVEIIANGSSSHHELRKLTTRMSLIQSAMKKSGGVYLYANQFGMDGGRMYFDGSALVCVNGEVVQQGLQFGISDIDLVIADVDLDEVRSYRASKKSRCNQSAQLNSTFPRVVCKEPFRLCNPSLKSSSGPKPPCILDPMMEIAYGPALWLWDYLRRSGAKGFFIPLSGGADSASVLALTGFMCRLVMNATNNQDMTVIRDLRRICNLSDKEALPKDDRDLISRLVYTAFMAAPHTGKTTASLAYEIAKEVGSNHFFLRLDKVTKAFEDTFLADVLKGDKSKMAKFMSEGGTYASDISLQNVQARSRMVMAYMLAQRLLEIKQREGTLLVLSCGNVDEALSGYLTKYDCTSGDINPIGGISKTDLREFLHWASTEFDYPTLAKILKLKPSAELRPQADNQFDEDDMGMTYKELSEMGKLRKQSRCGPVTMYKKLLPIWKERSCDAVAKKVKKFFTLYCKERHKSTILTPSYYAEAYTPEDNRFDLRQIIYPPMTRQFSKIDNMVLNDERQAE